MSRKEDFIIEDGTLFRYVGDGGEVTIPKGVVRIHGRAFFRCESLTAITLPAGVTRIHTRAFAGCTNLTRITLPSTLLYVGPAAFVGCSGLKKVCFQGTRAQWDAIPPTPCNHSLYNAHLSYITPFPNP